MTDSGVARRQLGPRDCAFALALATTRGQFDTDRGRADKEFARLYKTWERYRQEVAAPALRLLPRMEKLGATVIQRATLGDLGRIFRRDDAVIVLMAHWRKSGAIELADGFAGVDDVVGTIPRDTARILDLGACQPWPLAQAVRRRRPGCIVRWTDADATPAIWLHFYDLVFVELLRQQRTYLQAVANVTLELRHRTDGLKHRKRPSRVSRPGRAAAPHPPRQDR